MRPRARGEKAIAFKHDRRYLCDCGIIIREQRTRRMFPTLPDALSKPEFEQLLRGLAPAKAESWREFWTICEVLQAMKEAEYPRPFWFSKSIHRVLALSVEERTPYWRKLRYDLLEHAHACDQGLQRMTLKLLRQILRFRSPSSAYESLRRVPGAAVHSTPATGSVPIRPSRVSRFNPFRRALTSSRIR